MKIILGQELDKGSYPDALGDQEGSIGKVVVGPAGLVGILETRLGLTKKRQNEPIRIGNYLKVLKDIDDGAWFYSKSLEADAWSTAKTILGWRDELKFCGWNGGTPPGVSERLKTLGELEKIFRNELIEAMGDRIQVIIAALNGHAKLDIEELQVVESRKSWPSCWSQVFDSLAKCGAPVKEIAPNFQTNSGNLGRLQIALETGNPCNQKLSFDGSLCVVTAPTEWEACEAIASFLEANRQNQETDGHNSGRRRKSTG